MTARRPLLTAAAAGSVLLALWFVPSANATAEADGATPPGLRAAAAPAGSGLTDATGSGPAAGGAHTGSGGGSGPARGPQAAGSAVAPHHLADTGSPDTTPYVIGGAASLALGAGLVSYSVRRTRDGSA
ncbi:MULTISPECIES: hypothetical protein [Streptomyces]|uniref:hypothetical protein n=1 Tax=Streptomyces TaxID=1883 RepID=UPI000A05E2B2|nr:hypothetical protein [Streptomyces sp. MOE7]ARH92908.1 hypothetical protein STRMOE7_24485 [Streptomyces sp. MOE7]